MRVWLWVSLAVLALARAEEAAEAAEGPSMPYPGEQPAKAPADEELTEAERKARKEKAANYVYCEYDDCYELLGVKRDSGPIPIKRAYRRLAAEWHPDKCPGGDVAKCRELFPKYANAYEVLSNPEMRRNYDYVLKHPYEFPGYYLTYSRPKYAPKSDLRFVLLMTVLIASVVQYLFRKSQYEQTLQAVKKDPRSGYQERLKAMLAKKPAAAAPSGGAEGSSSGGAAPSSPNKKASKAEALEARRKEAEAELDAEFAAEMASMAPKAADTLAAAAFKLPITTLKYAQWYLAGGASEPAYRTRRALGLSSDEWALYSEGEQAELVGMELWVGENMEAYEEQLRLEKAKSGKSSKEKRMARFKKNNPSSNAGLDG